MACKCPKGKKKAYKKLLKNGGVKNGKYTE